MSGLWKKVIASLGMFGLVGLMGCVAKPTTNTKDYLRCNDTSWDNMAEIESGFFYLYDKILYYADKADMNTWIPVCNKPDCSHSGESCNGYVGFEIAQKGEQLYYVGYEAYATGMNSYKRVFVNELLIDGSGSKKVYEIPFEDGNPMMYNSLISSRSLILYYQYLNEEGMYQHHIARLEDDGTLYNMYSKKTESGGVSSLLLSSSASFIRGDEGIICDILTLSYNDKATGSEIYSTLWRMDGEKPELVPIPEEVQFGWSYLTEDYIIDYESRDGYEKGYYQYDFNTGEKILLGKAEQDNAKGYVMTEDCVVECNRYRNHSPENPYLKIYHNEEWKYVPLPEIVTELEKTSFIPVSIASDRIFFEQEMNGEKGYGCRLYYVMLEDEKPELTYCTTFGNDDYFDLSKLEQSTESKNNENLKWQDLDMTIFDTEDYLLKVTGVGLAPKEDEEDEDIYMITMYCENRKPEEELYFVLQEGAINGIYTWIPQNIRIDAGENSKECSIYVNKTYSEIYDFDEFTDISFLVYDRENKNAQKEVHVYPQGEEKAIIYTRESQPTDVVLIDNEYVTVTIVGYESNAIENDTVKLFIENKSDTNIAWMRQEFPNINGVGVKPYKTSGGNRIWLVSEGIMKVLPPNVCAYEALELPSEFLAENGVTRIENFDVTLQFWYGETWDEELLSETYTITP